MKRDKISVNKAIAIYLDSKVIQKNRVVDGIIYKVRLGDYRDISIEKNEFKFFNKISEDIQRNELKDISLEVYVLNENFKILDKYSFSLKEHNNIVNVFPFDLRVMITNMIDKTKHIDSILLTSVFEEKNLNTGILYE